jgi:glycosyltransferase involved in cell wall biosynthesis
VRRRASEFDVLHFHVDLLHFPIFRELGSRTVTTLHGRLDLPDLAPFYAAFDDMPLVAISHDQRSYLPDAHWVGTIHHGLPAETLALSAEPRGDYLAFIGRISPEKRPDRAIAIARRAGMKLRIAAKVDAADRDYFRRSIEPLLASPHVEFIGEIGEHQKAEFLGKARALLFPVDWPEPFGLVMIEAMACGTPIIGWRCGALPEVIEDGVTGYVVESELEAASAVARIDALDRRQVRRRFEQRFSASRMARDYLNVYRALLERADNRALAA